MNIQECDILNALLRETYKSQRILSEVTGHSVGVVNRSLKYLKKECIIDTNMRPTKIAVAYLEKQSPKNAIILAAGFGMRMVPINTLVPKALMEVNGEPLIERIIHQLHYVGIKDIHVVVGYMKEQFEYLIDEYGVDLIVNEVYSEKNNLHSLALASSFLSNSYIIPCDIWCEKNPFRRDELYSWYMVSENMDTSSTVRVNRKMELVTSNGGNRMIGIAYLTSDQANTVKRKLVQYDACGIHDGDFWEETLIEQERMIVPARVVNSAGIFEINTYEQLRELDKKSNNLKSEAITIIMSSLGIDENEIVDISVLKKGMTNRSFLFKCRGNRYIMRIPGEGTDKLINRKEEVDVYKAIQDKDISDDVIYINSNNGYKISEYYENSRVCDPNNVDDLFLCMRRLKSLHNMKLKVKHEFDLYKQIDFYESLWDGKESIYKDYKKTKDQILELKPFIDEHIEEKVLSHIDAVPDNFIFTDAGDIRLIDWEYSGMQDPHVDIAMFCIYALYDRAHIDKLIDIYFEGICPDSTRLKIYCYIAVCGLLWSNWCEYKRNLGIEFGEYSIRQYRYAKDYYRIFMYEINKLNLNVGRIK